MIREKRGAPSRHEWLFGLAGALLLLAIAATVSW